MDFRWKPTIDRYAMPRRSIASPQSASASVNGVFQPPGMAQSILMAPERRSALLTSARWGAGAFVMAIVAACGSLQRSGAPPVTYLPGARVDMRDAESVKKKLYVQYNQWKGTKYQIGGLSKDGIDCSGFVYVTYRSEFRIVLPRSTESQAEVGKSLGRSELRSGDLVFFKTGIALRHVGIYLERGKLLHASTGQGVMISDFNDDYWKSAYWMARRIEG